MISSARSVAPQASKSNSSASEKSADPSVFAALQRAMFSGDLHLNICYCRFSTTAGKPIYASQVETKDGSGLH